MSGHCVGGSEMNEIDQLLEEVAAYLTTAKAVSNLDVKAWYEHKAAERCERALWLASLRGYSLAFTGAIDLQKREPALAG
jgi:hypothetical protein